MSDQANETIASASNYIIIFITEMKIAVAAFALDTEQECYGTESAFTERL
jgi:hypothetical protein